MLGHDVHDRVTLSAYKPDLGLQVYAQSPVILSLKKGSGHHVTQRLVVFNVKFPG